KAASELHADHQRDQHRDRLAEHGSFGFDATHAPAKYAQAIDHGGVRVGANQRVGISGALAVCFVHKHDSCKELEVYLVDDAGIRRNDGEIAEGCLSPAQESVALLVAQKLQLGIQTEGFVGTELVDLDRMVNHQFCRLQRIDQRRIAAQALHRVAHGSEVD